MSADEVDFSDSFVTDDDLKLRRESSLKTRNILLSIIAALIALLAVMSVFLLKQEDTSADESYVRSRENTVTDNESEIVSEDYSKEDIDEVDDSQDNYQGNTQFQIDEHTSSSESSINIPQYMPSSDNYLEYTLFESPSGNIVCEIEATGGSDDSVSCQIYEEDHEENGLEGCKTGYVTLTVGFDSAEMTCAADWQVQSVVTLEYEEETTAGDYACLSSEYGMQCWNIYTGRGFAVAKGGWVSIEEGSVRDGRLPWY